MKVYRGSAGAARAYVETDRARADDYYLAEGNGLADRYAASPTISSPGEREGEHEEHGVRPVGTLDGDAYGSWVAGHDPVTGAPKGRLRSDAQGVRFVEVVVNGPKSWSLAAALSPEVAAAYEAAQDRAAVQIIGWLAEHATTRVGPRGRQVQVPVQEIEAAVIRHYTSRAGDPHRHLHLQINARVFAEGKWRGLHTVGVRDSLDAINGIGHAAVVTDPGFRAALAAHGYTIDTDSGEVVELASYIGAFSDRAAQIGRNVDRYEAQWRAEHPGEEPGPRLRRSWDARAWADARPDKVVPRNGAELAARWVEELDELGCETTGAPAHPAAVPVVRVGELDRVGAVETILARLGARRSGWNAADVRGEVEQLIAHTGIVTEPAVRIELAEDLTARTLKGCVPLLDGPLIGPGVPEHIRSLTSAHVLGIEADIVTRLANRAWGWATASVPVSASLKGLDEAQRQAIGVLAGPSPLAVVEGAAGVGKTTTLAAVQEALADRGRRMLVVTPTLKAAQVASREIGDAGSVAWLLHQHGFRWDDDGSWNRIAANPVGRALLAPGDLLLVDEAGMLDQDAARALLTVADEMGTQVALLGDRHQLSAVGRGGVLDLAARWVNPTAHVDLEVVHRFADPEFAAISLALRTGSPTYAVSASAERRAVCEPVGERVGEVWAALCRRDQIRIHPSEAERTHAIAREAAEAVLAGHHGDAALVMTDTREQAAALNGAIRDCLVSAGYLDDLHALTTGAGERLGVGDRVATRRNDPELGVTNRATWTVTALGEDGSLTLRGRCVTDTHNVPLAYARQHVELAYATTVYGAQGETTRIGHLLLGEHTSAASAYVGMTRGTHDNVAHLVAEDLDDAREQWGATFARDRADLGPAVAAHRAAEDIDRYGTQKPTRPLDAVLVDLREAWTQQADLTQRQARLVAERDSLQQIAAITARYAPRRERLRAAEETSRDRWRDARQALAALDHALHDDDTTLCTQVWENWRTDLRDAQSAAAVDRDGTGRLGQRRRQVREAHADLTAFAENWRPVLPDLSHEPAQLAHAVTGLYGRRITDAVDTYVTSQVIAAHPDARAIRSEMQAAREDHEAVVTARQQLDQALYDELKPYGRLGYTHDPHAELTGRSKELASVDEDIACVGRRVDKLHGEHAIHSLPEGALDAARHAWQSDRTQQQETARRDAQKSWQRAQEARRHQRRSEPAPTYTPPDFGPGIGR